MRFSSVGMSVRTSSLLAVRAEVEATGDGLTGADATGGGLSSRAARLSSCARSGGRQLGRKRRASARVILHCRYRSSHAIVHPLHSPPVLSLSAVKSDSDQPAHIRSKDVTGRSDDGRRRVFIVLDRLLAAVWSCGELDGIVVCRRGLCPAEIVKGRQRRRGAPTYGVEVMTASVKERRGRKSQVSWSTSPLARSDSRRL